MKDMGEGMIGAGMCCIGLVVLGVTPTIFPSVLGFTIGLLLLAVAVFRTKRN